MEMSDRAIFWTCTILTALWFAFTAGFFTGSSQTQRLECPTVKNEKVISTMKDSFGHYCTYVRDGGYGQSKRKQKI